MKIDWLRLENFKNLTSFEVDFSLKSERQVIIGRNGVGKSNILESIAWIFRDLGKVRISRSFLPKLTR